ncbi:MAG: hypothetical protein ABIQ95_09375, partial [Bdellovibrionia bacterium]
MKNKLFKSAVCLPLTALAVVFSMSTVAQAEDTGGADQGAYAGILIGGNISTASNGTITDSTMTPTLALTLGTKMPTNFGFGLFGSYYSRTSSGTFLGLPSGTNTGTTMLLGQGNYYFMGAH